MNDKKTSIPNQIPEAVLDPDLPIIDPHHHLMRWPGFNYELDDFRADTGSGHNIVKTVFVQCGTQYRQDGPTHLRPVGETEFVVDIAAQSQAGGGAAIEGIVAHADLRLGDAVEAVLDAHKQVAGGLLKGIPRRGEG